MFFKVEKREKRGGMSMELHYTQEGYMRYTIMEVVTRCIESRPEWWCSTTRRHCKRQ
jgi:hypothetical protein